VENALCRIAEEGGNPIASAIGEGEEMPDIFRFFHLPNWPGYKAGALNFGITQTAPDATVIGVIDSDYMVTPDWLRATIPYFDRKEIAFVQAPQDYAMPAKAPSNVCAIGNMLDSSISAWFNATNATRSSSTAR